MKKSCKNCNHFEHCVRVYNLDSRCVDYEAKPITNEEYIRNCSTEELAKFLQSVNKYCDYMHNCKKCPTKCKNGGWIGWLKEKHE